MKRTLLAVLLASVLTTGSLIAQEASASGTVGNTTVTATPTSVTVTTETKTEVNYLDRFYTRKALSHKEGTTIFVNSDVFFKLTSEDKETGLDKLEFSIDDGIWKTYTAPFNILNEGPHVIQYRGIDNGGNVEKVKVFSVVVDNSSPSATIATDRALYEKGGVVYASSKTNFYVSSADNAGGSGVKLAYAGTQISQVASRGDGTRDAKNYFTLETEGPNTLYYTALDNVGNLAKLAQFNAVIDATPPVVSLVSSANLKSRDGEYLLIPSESLKTAEGSFIATANDRVSFTANDNLSGVSALYVKVNNEDYVQYFQPIEIKGASEYTISVKAVDNVGNASEPTTFKFKVDATAPASSVNLTSKEGGEVSGQ